jgi:hypothetical protein
MISSKKRVLAASIAAAVGLTAGNAGAFIKAQNGIGVINYVPYFTTQNGNATLIHVTNTDTVNGKAVKVRFRGAEWSDDVFDFTLFLSPGDVWTGAVTQAESGLSQMTTTDNSCTLPEDINQEFITFRLGASPDPEAGTREGYVEFITMADIPPVAFDPLNETTYLYTATKHVDSVAPCNGALDDAGTISGVLNGLIEDSGPALTYSEDDAASYQNGTPGENQGQGMVVPVVGSLMTYAVNLNVPESKAFTNEGTAIEFGGPTEGAATRKIFFEQKNVPIANSRLLNEALTADLIFAPEDYIDGDQVGGIGLQAFQFDLPDTTTAYGAWTQWDQRDLITDALRRGNAYVEYLTDDVIQATTDVVFNQPTRRFYYWYDKSCQDPDPAACDYVFEVGEVGEVAQEVPTDIIGEGAVSAEAPYTVDPTYASLVGGDNTIEVGTPIFFDREENEVEQEDDIVISPRPPATAPFSLIGEVAVVSLNNGAPPTGSLDAELTAIDYTTGLDSPDGWAILSTTGADGRLPVIGFTAFKAFNAAAGAAGTNYGGVLPLRTPVGEIGPED